MTQNNENDMVLVRRGDLNQIIDDYAWANKGSSSICQKEYKEFLLDQYYPEFKEVLQSPSQGWINIPKEPTDNQIEVKIVSLEELNSIKPIKYEDVQIYRGCAETFCGEWWFANNGYLTKSEAIKACLNCVKDNPEYSGRVGIFDATTNTITDIQR